VLSGATAGWSSSAAEHPEVENPWGQISLKGIIMSMTVKTQVNGEKAKLSLRGRFDFTAHREFRQGYESVLQQPGIKGLEVDLGGVDYIDSSALGMLLLLKESAEHGRAQLALTNCTGSVRRVLDVANFGKLFSLS
jgi:anti-anti-sigma factor